MKVVNRYLSYDQQETVAVIGAGWYGAHISSVLAEKGYAVTLYESAGSIFSGISGKFGIRIHVGPHYPRSSTTRMTCRNGFNEFLLQYPELVNQHEYAIYALGKTDADGKPSKVDAATFEAVCSQFRYKGKVDLKTWGYNAQQVIDAYDFDEPSAVLGPRLRTFFEKRLSEKGVTVRCKESVKKLEKRERKVLVTSESSSTLFDHAINTTSYKDFFPRTRPLPFDIQVVFQPCLALIYEDTTPEQSGKPISFIVMDGWFPCLMPYDDRTTTEGNPIKKYVLTHGKWTIMASYKSIDDAQRVFSTIDDAFISENVRGPAEEHMKTFWPSFDKRFKYQGWTGAVLAKIKTEKEFRGSVVFQDPDSNVISVFPGKITNIFDAERDVHALIEKLDIAETPEGYKYNRSGILHFAEAEILQKPGNSLHSSTTELQTFRAKLQETTLKTMGTEKTHEKPKHDKKSMAYLTTALFTSLASLYMYFNVDKDSSSMKNATAYSCFTIALFCLYRRVFASFSHAPKSTFFGSSPNETDTRYATQDNRNSLRSFLK